MAMAVGILAGMIEVVTTTGNKQLVRSANAPEHLNRCD